MKWRYDGTKNWKFCKLGGTTTTKNATKWLPLNWKDTEREQSDNAGAGCAGAFDAVASSATVGEPMAVRLPCHVVGSLPATSRAHRVNAGGQWLRSSLPRPLHPTQQTIGRPQRCRFQMHKLISIHFFIQVNWVDFWNRLYDSLRSLKKIIWEFQSFCSSSSLSSSSSSSSAA